MLSYRKAQLGDLQLYFDWANDISVRSQSYNSDIIKMEDHVIWFSKAIINEDILMLVFQNESCDFIGQVRIENQGKHDANIGVSIDREHRGKGYAKEILLMATEVYFKSVPHCTIHAYIKKTNLGSKYSFEKAGFIFQDIVNYQNYESFHFLKKNKKCK